MKKILGSAVSVSIITMLSLSITGCSPQESNNPSPAPAVSATADPETPKEEKGFVASYQTKMSLQDEKKFTDNNYLKVGTDNKFSINASGFLEQDKENKAPADGEKFHAINYSYDLLDLAYDEKPPVVTFTIDGKTRDVNQNLFKEGTLLVSAPENASIDINIQRDGVTQTIGFKDAERKSEGIADTWYQTSQGKITDASVSLPVTVKEYTATLKYTVKEAVRTPYDSHDSLGWADNGKKTWIILDIDSPEWTVNNSTITKADQEGKISLKDSNGKTYTPVSAKDNTSNKVAFEVDPDQTNFTVHTENSMTLNSFGQNVGTTGTVTSDAVKISFESGKA